MQNIFLVEDDKILNAGICHHLHAAGYKAASVYTYTDAKKEIACNQFDLFILDIRACLKNQSDCIF